MAELIAAHFNYWAVAILMMVGLYVVFESSNMVKRLAGLSVFQTSVFLFYISMGKVVGGSPPILPERHGAAADVPGAIATLEFSASALDQTYSNPLPHVLILTAIVVGVATLAVGLALVVLIREAYGTIEEDEIAALEHDANTPGGQA